MIFLLKLLICLFKKNINFATMQKTAFIINPFSSKGNYQPLLEQLEKNIAKPLVFISDSIKGTDNFIKENWDNVEVFVAIGGDGTISTVAKSIINSDKILGIIPAGSGNGFANETQFNKDIDSLLNKIKNKKFQVIDSFMVNEHFSINLAGVGFDAEVAKNFEKTSRGFSNYIKTTINTFFKYNPISIEFEEPYQAYNGKYLMMNIANSRQFGNNAYIAPMADLQDGLVDIVLVKKMPFTEAIPFALRMFNKTLKDNQYITYLKSEEIRFSVNTDTWHLDGEYKPINSPIAVKVLKNSLKVLV